MMALVAATATATNENNSKTNIKRWSPKQRHKGLLELSVKHKVLSVVLEECLRNSEYNDNSNDNISSDGRWRYGHWNHSEYCRVAIATLDVFVVLLATAIATVLLLCCCCVDAVLLAVAPTPEFLQLPFA